MHRCTDCTVHARPNIVNAHSTNCEETHICACTDALTALRTCTLVCQTCPTIVW